MTKRRMFFPLLLVLLLFTGCAGGAETYTQYVQAVMDCTYRNESAQYCALTGASAAEALALYEEEVDYVAELMCSQMAVKPEYLTPETREGYRELARELMGSLHYTVQSVIPEENGFQVTLLLEPTDLWDICIDDVEAAYRDYYSERFGRVGIDYRSEVKLAKVEANWGAEVLSILRRHIPEVGSQTPVTAQFSIRPDAAGHYNVSGKDWMDVDDLLLDIGVNN